MNKKIFIFLLIAVFLAIIIAGGYYFYKNPIGNNDYQNNNISKETNDPVDSSCEGDQCIVETNKTIDGIFQKIENDLLYIKPKDSEEIQSIKMATDIAFSEITLSESYENIGEKSIVLADLVNGNQISVVVIYNISSPDELTATSISRVITQKVAGEIENNRIIDSIFQKAEDGLLYFKEKNSEEIQSIKMAENVIFVEVTLSESYENIGEKSISLIDFSDGDSISIIAGFNDENEEVIPKLIRIIVLDSDSN